MLDGAQAKERSFCAPKVSQDLHEGTSLVNSNNSTLSVSLQDIINNTSSVVTIID